MPNPIINRRNYSQSAGSGLSPRTNDWVTRILTNGGVQPSTPVMNAVDTMDKTMVSAGLDTKIIANCWFTMPNLINIRTPYYHFLGSDPWADVFGNLGPANLVTNGFYPNGAGGGTRGISPQFSPADAFTGNPFSAGFVLYAASTPGPEIGSGGTNGCTGQPGNTDFSNAFALDNTVGGVTYAECYGVAASGTNYTSIAGPLTGWMSMQRTANNRLDLYNARSNLAHASVANATGTLAAPTLSAISIAIGFLLTGNGNFGEYNGDLSYAAITYGMSNSEDNIHFNAVQAALQSIGVGYL